MATNINITQITPPRVPIVDDRTGAVSREWYRWFFNLYNITGGGLGITPVINGGTGLGTIPTNGQLLIGNGTGYTLNTLAVGNGISVVNGLGTITLANTGVLSNIAGTGISVSGATGNVTIANTGVLSFSSGTTGLTPAAVTTGNIVLAGTLGIANGGTNGSAAPTAYGVAYGTGTAYAFTAAGTAKQVLRANTSSAPTWTTLTSGTSILYGDGSGGFSNVTIGTGVSFVAGTLSATGSGGTVTSVTGTSPVVSSGGATPAISLATAYGDTLNPYASKTANFVLAAPNGSAGVPTFRALVAADVPGSALTKTDDTNVTLTLGGSASTALLNAASLTLGWTGTLATTRGGTGLTSFTSGGVVYASSTSALTTGSALTFNGTDLSLTGNVVMATSGKGIDFSATPGTGTSELLADYEEGDWTPALALQTPGDSSFTYSTRTGKYTKVGRLVTVSAIVTVSAYSNTTGTGNLRLTGFPFSNGSTFQGAGSNFASVSGFTVLYPNGARIPNAQSIAVLQALSSAAATSDLNYTNVTASSSFLFTALYYSS
jgi:hypothetical protein